MPPSASGHSVYPPEVIGDTLQDHFAEFSGKSYTVYTTILVALMAGVASLPLIHVNVAVTTSGVIRPQHPRTTVNAGRSGIAKSVLVASGDTVEDGSPLLQLQEDLAEGQQEIVRRNYNRKQALASDLSRLASIDTTVVFQEVSLQTTQYRQELAALRSELRTHRLKMHKVRRDLNRQKQLFESESIAEKKLQNTQSEYTQTKAHLGTIINEYRRRWLSSLSQLRSEVQTLRSQLQEMSYQEALHAVRAPLTGTVSQMRGIAPGSYVQSGQEIAVISPTDSLVARIQVTPTDIGLLEKGAPVRFQIHAYNYRNWGFVSGKIKQISDDVQVRNGSPVYVVECSLESKTLSLPNGATGSLQKGMTLSARFPVARRSVWELLYQDVDDYLNPIAPAT